MRRIFWIGYVLLLLAGVGCDAPRSRVRTDEDYIREHAKTCHPEDFPDMRVIRDGNAESMPFTYWTCDGIDSHPITNYVNGKPWRP